MNLPLPSSGKIQHIFHFADVHIRDGDSTRSRFYEYLQVIDNTIHMLKSHPSISEGSAVSILVGDTLDHKSKLGGAGCTLFNYFLKGLSQCGPVYIIQGNHDFQQAFPDEPSMLDALLINVPENVYYMNKSGHYIAGSIGFGLVLTRETLILGSGAGQLETLPPFPDPNQFPNHIVTKIALFHGTVKGCLLQNYHPSQEGYPKDWIQGYDLQLLGDIHLEQIHGAIPLTELSSQNRRKIFTWENCKDVWAYPGSLVQQSFGENPFSNHGYLHWDLSTKQVHVYPVHNQYAKLYLKCVEGDWLVSFPQKRWEPINNALDVGRFKHVELRIRNRIKPENIETLHQLLSTHAPMTYEITNGLLNNHIYEEVEVENREGDADQIIHDNDSGKPLTCEQYNSPQTWIQYIEEHHNAQILMPVADKWQGWLLNPISLLIREEDVDPSNKKVVADRNKKIQKIIEELLSQLNQNSSRTYLKIRYLEWNWLLCYGENNWVNFDELTQQIAGAKAANHKGKSAFFDIICLGLFGKPTPLRKNTDGVIHDSKPHGKRPTVSIVVDVNGDTYRISREFSKLETGTTQNVKPMVCRLFKDGYKTVAQGSTVSKWVSQNIGDRKDFLLSSMITQVQDQNFIFVGHREQLDILDNSLNLNAYNTLLNLLQETRNAYLSIASKHQTICTKVRSSMVTVDNEVVETSQKEYEKGLKTCKELEKYLSSLQIDSDIVTQTQDISTDLIQKYIQAHEQNILQLEGSNSPSSIQTLQDCFNGNPHSLYREWKDKLLTQQTQWDASFKHNYDPSFRPETLANALNNYRLLTGKETDGTQDGETLQSPTINRDLLEHESKAIAEWRAKWQLFLTNPSCQKALEDTLQQIQYTSQQIQQIQQECITLREKNDLSCLSEETEDYKTWQTKNSTFLMDDDEYTTLQNYCHTHPLLKPTTSEETIKQLEADLETELATLRDPKWRNSTLELDNRLLAEIQDRYTKLDTEATALRTSIITAQKLQRPTEVPVLKEPTVPAEDCSTWISDFNQRLECLAEEKKKMELLERFSAHKWDRLQKQIDLNAEFQTKINEINSSDYPFNPDCEACRKQPWRLELEAITQKRLNTEQTISNMQKESLEIAAKLADIFGYDISFFLKITQKNLNNILEPLKASITKTEKEVALNRLSEYQNQLQKWEEYKLYLDRVKQYKTNMEIWISNKDKIIQLQSDLTATNQLLQDCQLDLNGLQYCINNRAKWNRTLMEYADIRKQWKEFTANEAHHVKLEKAKTVRTQSTAWNIRNRICKLDQESELLTTRLTGLKANEQHYRQFLEEKENMDQRKKALQNNTAIWSAWTLLQKLRNAEVAHIFNQKMALVENKTQYLHWKLILHNRTLQTQAADCEQKLTTFRERNTELLKQITTYENSLEIMKKQQDECNLLGKQIENLTTTQLAISHLIDIFTDFRQWLYQNKIIPRLLQSANEISDLIVGKDEHRCKLSCNITFGNRKEMILDWRVHSSAGDPSIHYAGGFQKIIYGLALRIAIANIGASSIVCKQFFIDEGFSSADMEHLGRVEILLSNLLNLYDSIIMVTHIETLQESITTNMTIQRDEQHLTSTLRQGARPSDIMGSQFAHHNSKDAPPTISPNRTQMNLDDAGHGDGHRDRDRNGDGDATTVEIAIQSSETSLNNLSNLAHNLEHNLANNHPAIDMIQLDPDKCQGIVQSSGKQCRFKKKIGDYCKKHART